MVTDTYIALSPSPVVAMARVMDDPLSPSRACAHLANGGDLVSLATAWGVRYSDLASWLSRSHTDAYRDALKARSEYVREMVSRELAGIALSDIRQCYDGAGELLPISAWPDTVARAVQGISADGRPVLADKLKALELIGKMGGLFVERVDMRADVAVKTYLVFPDGHPGAGAVSVDAEQAPTAQVEP